MTGGVLKTAAHPSESSGHWYEESGRQVDLVEGAKGQAVKPDVRHARKLNLGPGVTTIMGCADKPGLVRWQVNQAVMAALTNPQIQHIDPADEGADKRILGIIAEDAGAEAKQARDLGTSFHAAMQDAIEQKPDQGGGWGPWVEKVLRECIALGMNRGAMSEVGCTHPLGYGTKADLIGGGWLLDFKGKPELTDETTKLRDEHFMQLAATREALRHHGYEIDRCGIGFFSRTSPDFVVTPVRGADLERGWEMFQGLLRYWQALKRHRPNWGSTAPER